jgi:hypothetical protein
MVQIAQTTQIDKATWIDNVAKTCQIDLSDTTDKIAKTSKTAEITMAYKILDKRAKNAKINKEDNLGKTGLERQDCSDRKDMQDK